MQRITQPDSDSVNTCCFNMTQYLCKRIILTLPIRTEQNGSVCLSKVDKRFGAVIKTSAGSGCAVSHAESVFGEGELLRGAL